MKPTTESFWSELKDKLDCCDSLPPPGGPNGDSIVPRGVIPLISKIYFCFSAKFLWQAPTVRRCSMIADWSGKNQPHGSHLSGTISDFFNRNGKINSECLWEMCRNIAILVSFSTPQNGQVNTFINSGQGFGLVWCKAWKIWHLAWLCFAIACNDSKCQLHFWHFVRSPGSPEYLIWR